MRVELHTVYRVYIHLNKFYNIDLTSRGYYQIRLVPKNSSDYSNLDIKVSDKVLPTFSTSLLPCAVIDGVGISKTIEILYADEIVDLEDTFCISVQFHPGTDFKTPRKLTLELELWYMDRDRPPKYELLHVESRRTLEIELNPTRLVGTSRVINFEYLVPSSLHFTVFASLVSIMPRRRKPPPDPPLSQRLQELHEEVCSALMSSTESLENFVQQNSHHIAGVVHFARSESNSDMKSLSERLQSSERPWATLEACVVQLSAQMDRLFDQMIQLFGRCNSLYQSMLHEFLEQRLKILGEGFFFWEKPLSVFSNTLPSQHAEMYVHVGKSRYLQKMPKQQVFCLEIDAPNENCPIIFEEYFGAVGPTTSIRAASSPTVPVKQKEESKKRAKSFRLINLRRKSAEGNANRAKRSSVDSAMTQSVKSPPLSDLVRPLATTPQQKEDELLIPASIDLPAIPQDPIRLALLLSFVKEREAMKKKLLSKCNYEGHLYSELASNNVRPQCFALLPDKETRPGASEVQYDYHLVVLVHGLEGTKDDLLPYRNALKSMGNQKFFDFLMSHTNSMQTWADFETMSRNLLTEIKDHINYSQREPKKISFIAHSMGGIIVRGALGLSDADFLFDKLHTFMTINTPHLGLTYTGRGIQWGVQFIRWWKQSKSMEQLALRDEMAFQNAFLVRLSQNRAFGRFKNVLLVGSPADLLVPSHSSLLEPCKNSTKDLSALGTAFRDMLTCIYSDLTSTDHPRTVVRYTTFHNNNTAKAARLTGRAAHIAPIEDDIFIEKLFSISALRYFTDT